MRTPVSAVDTGLSTAEVVRRREESGPNQVAQRGRVSVWSSAGAQLRDPLVLVLLVACVLTVLAGDLSDTVVIALVVVVNTTVGIVQELRADREITALAELTAPHVRVRRDGREQMVPSPDLVPGDVVLLAEGDVVPADCETVESSALLVDEAALTGESVPVGKAAGRDGDAGDMLLAGTVVVRGRAVAVVDSVGPASALGRIADLMDTRVQQTPLQRRLAGLGRVLALVAIVLCALVLLLGVLRGNSLEVMLVTAISLAVAAVPESLPAVVTLSLALGARRMAARHAVVRRLPAVETLGAVTVLATDKTGTLTRAQMVVEELWTPERTIEVSGTGYSPVGGFTSDGEALVIAEHADALDLLRAALLCNDARLAPPTEGEEWSGLGDPTEVALCTAAAKAGLYKDDLDAAHPRLDEVPFDSTRQCMTTVHETETGVLVVSKGSVEALHVQHADGDNAADWDAAVAQAEALADRGFRVLAVAAGEARRDRPWRKAPLRLLGLVAMDDPAKPAARSTIDRCAAAGIHPVLITGDHPATARAVAEAVGIVGPRDSGTRVATGAQLAAGEVPDPTEVRVFARTTPEQKLDIVQAWKDRCAVVAMTGDGVNDGPALHRADIGVAMGHRGTEVARQAADLVLADDDLDTVVAAVDEGRRVYANIRRFLLFGLSGGAAEIAVMLLGPFVGLGVPLLAAQILWINLLTHGLTGVAMGAEPSEPGAMRRGPRPPGESVLGDGLWQRVLMVAAGMTLTALALAVWGQATDRYWQSLLFVALVSMQLGVAIGARPRMLTLANPFLPLAVAGSFLLAVAGVYVPILQALLGTTPLPFGDLVVAALTAPVGWCLARLTAAGAARRKVSASSGFPTRS